MKKFKNAVNRIKNGLIDYDKKNRLYVGYWIYLFAQGQKEHLKVGIKGF